MAGIMGLFASELDEFVADYDNQFWDASFHGETYPPRIIMERSTPPLYRVEDDGTKALEPNPTIQIIAVQPRRRAAGAVPARIYAGAQGNGGGAE